MVYIKPNGNAEFLELINWILLTATNTKQIATYSPNNIHIYTFSSSTKTACVLKLFTGLFPRDTLFFQIIDIENSNYFYYLQNFYGFLEKNHKTIFYQRAILKFRSL